MAHSRYNGAMRRFLSRLMLVVIVIIALPLVGSRFLGWGQADPAALPPEGRPIVISEGEVVNVVESGAPGRGKPPVILVHGLPSCAADWAGVPGKLAALGHRVIAYDRVGFGYSSRPDLGRDRYSLDSNGRDLIGLMDALAIKRALLVGWSYGGAIVQQVAANHPDRVVGLVLLGSSGPDVVDSPPDPLEMIIGTGFGTPILQWLTAVPFVGPGFTRLNLAEAFAGEEHIPDGWFEYTRGMLALPGTLRSFVAEVRNWDPDALPSTSVRTPTLIIHGDDDRLVPEAVGKALNDAIPTSRLQIVAGGSHMLPVTHPTLVAKSIHAHFGS